MCNKSNLGGGAQGKDPTPLGKGSPNTQVLNWVGSLGSELVVGDKPSELSYACKF